MTGDWDAYLAGFHADRPGVTERVLERSPDDRGRTAYAWIAAALPAAGPVLDVACGSAPLWSPSLAGRYLGTDVAEAELALARARGARVERAQAASQPVADGAAAAVACSMALQVLPDLPGVLRELRRVLPPGGALVATVPTNRAGAADLPVGAGLVAALGRVPGYRNDRALRGAADLLARAGFRLESDEHRVFRFPITGREDAALLAGSLYLPGGGDEAAARRRATAWLARADHAPVPIRRLVAYAV